MEMKRTQKIGSHLWSHIRKLCLTLDILLTRLPLLHRSQRLAEIFPKPAIVAFKRDTNLGDLLVHKKYRRIFKNNDIEYKKGSSSCGSDCRICPYMLKCDKIQDSAKIREFTVNDSITCDTNNLVYTILCEKCDKILYVGETERSLKKRFIDHLSIIKTKKPTPVAIHFSANGHCETDLKIIGIEKVKQLNTIYRRLRERLWIKLLNTLSPNGINQHE